MDSLFKIVYQDGVVQSDQSTFLFIPYDVWFTSIITVGLFFAGYVANSFIGKQQAKNRLKELQEYFSQLIIMLKDPLHRQVNEYRTFSSKLQEARAQLLNLSELASFNVKQLRLIDPRDLYAIFITHGKGTTEERAKRFQKISECIGFLEQVKISNSKIADMYASNLIKYSRQYMDNIAIITKFLDGFESELYVSGTPLQGDVFLKTALNIKAVWMTRLEPLEPPFQDIHISKVHFIDPIRHLYANTIGDKRADIIGGHALDCAWAFENYMETKKLFAESLNNVANEISLTWTHLAQAVHEHDNKNY